MNRARSVSTRRYHAVRFYDNAKSLSQIVAAFLSEGFAAGQPGIVVATPIHRAAILRELVAADVNVVDVQRSGDLVLLDAEDTLSAFMADGIPNPEKFTSSMCEVIKRACQGRGDCTVRIYGEMVDVLGERVISRPQYVSRCSGTPWQIRKRFHFYVAMRWAISIRTPTSPTSAVTTRMLLRQTAIQVLLPEAPSLVAAKH